MADGSDSSAIQRVAERLRNMAQLSTQIARVEIEDNKVAVLWPTNLRVMADTLIEAGETLKRYADEIDSYTSRRQEDTDALVALAQTAANISTILGIRGGNLEILTHSDSNYVLGVLQKATEEARREVASRMSQEDREKWLRWLGWKSDTESEE